MYLLASWSSWQGRPRHWRIYWNTGELPYFDNRRVCVRVLLDVSRGVEYRNSLNTWLLPDYHFRPRSPLETPARYSATQPLPMPEGPGSTYGAARLILDQLSRKLTSSQPYGYEFGDPGCVKQVCDSWVTRARTSILLAPSQRWFGGALSVLKLFVMPEKIEPICMKSLNHLAWPCVYGGMTLLPDRRPDWRGKISGKRMKGSFNDFAYDAAMNCASWIPPSLLLFDDSSKKNGWW